MTELVLPWPPRELSPNARTHWRRAAPIKAKYRDACYILTKQSRAAIDWEGDVHVWIDYYAPDKRPRDLDNCIASSKSAFDGMADALGVNDRRFRLHPYLTDRIGGYIKIRFSKGPENA